MDILSLYEGVKFKDGIPNLFTATIRHTYEDVEPIQYNTYEVTESDEMRIDLIVLNMYEVPLYMAGLSELYKNIDIICTINNIDNPLNIKKGTILKYPPEGSLSNFRIEKERDLKNKKNSILNKIAVPNKKTKTDSARKKYQENNYSLPPTVNAKPKSPVSIENGSLKIGGV